MGQGIVGILFIEVRKEGPGVDEVLDMVYDTH